MNGTMTIGAKVFVRWYQNVLQGEVVANNKPNDTLFASMVHVRIPLQGCKIVAMFTPGHVYATADSVPGYDTKQPVKPAEQSAAAPSADDWLAGYRAFVQAHWNHEHNHLETDYLEAAYRLFREAVAKKLGYMPAASAPKLTAKPELVAVPEPAKPLEPAKTAQQPTRRSSRRAKKEQRPPRAVQLSLFDF